MLDIRWPAAGGDGPTPNAPAADYAAAVTAGATSASFFQAFPTPQAMAEPSEDGWGVLDEAGQRAMEEALRLSTIEEVHELIVLVEALDARGLAKTTEGAKAFAAEIKAVLAVAKTNFTGDAPLTVASNPAHAVHADGDRRSFFLPNFSKGSLPRSNLFSFLGHTGVTETDLPAWKLGTKKVVQFLMYIVQAAVQAQRCRWKDFVDPAESFPDASADADYADEWWFQRLKAIFLAGDTFAVLCSDNSPNDLADRAMDADESGENFGFVLYTCGGFHLLKELLKVTGDLAERLVYKCVARPLFPTDANFNFFLRGSDPRPRWLVDPLFAAGFRTSLVWKYREWRVQDDLSVDTVTWRDVHERFDAVCRVRPSLWSARFWLRSTDLASVLRGTGKDDVVGDFETFRAVNPIVTQLCALAHK